MGDEIFYMLNSFPNLYKRGTMRKKELSSVDQSLEFLLRRRRRYTVSFFFSLLLGRYLSIRDCPYFTLLYSPLLLYQYLSILYPRMFIVCRREVVGCVFLTFYLLFVSVDGWMDGCVVLTWLGCFFFLLFWKKKKTLCTQSVCVNATPFIHCCVPKKNCFQSASCLIFLLL